MYVPCCLRPTIAKLLGTASNVSHDLLFSKTTFNSLQHNMNIKARISCKDFLDR